MSGATQACVYASVRRSPLIRPARMMRLSVCDASSNSRGPHTSRRSAAMRCRSRLSRAATSRRSNARITAWTPAWVSGTCRSTRRASPYASAGSTTVARSRAFAGASISRAANHSSIRPRWSNDGGRPTGSIRSRSCQSKPGTIPKYARWFDATLLAPTHSRISRQSAKSLFNDSRRLTVCTFRELNTPLTRARDACAQTSCSHAHAYERWNLISDTTPCASRSVGPPGSARRKAISGLR